jgi:hypothetical protein
LKVGFLDDRLNSFAHFRSDVWVSVDNARNGCAGDPS